MALAGKTRSCRRDIRPIFARSGSRDPGSIRQNLLYLGCNHAGEPSALNSMSKCVTAAICFGLGLLGGILCHFPTSNTKGVSRASLELSAIKIDRANLAQGDLATLRKALDRITIFEGLAPNENEGAYFLEEISSAVRRLPVQKEGWSGQPLTPEVELDLRLLQSGLMPMGGLLRSELKPSCAATYWALEAAARFTDSANSPLIAIASKDLPFLAGNPDQLPFSTAARREHLQLAARLAAGHDCESCRNRIRRFIRQHSTYNACKYSAQLERAMREEEPNR